MKKFLSLLSTIALLALLSSCWSSIQPNASALCDSVLYDYDPNENIFYINAELMNPASKGASETGMNTSADLILKGKGKSPESAYEDISSALERRLLFSHNKARFISERLASDKFALESLFDFILRGATSDERALLFVVKNEDIENFYKSETGLQKLLGDYIDGLSKVQPEESSKGIFKNTLDFIKESGEVGREPVLGVLSVTKTDLKGSGNRGGGEPAEKSKEKFLLKAEGGAVFKNGVFTGYLNDKESVYYNILSNRSAFSTAEITTGGISATVGLYRPKTVIKAEIVNGNLEVNITVNARLRIVTLRGGKTENDLTAVTNATKAQLERETYEFIKRVQTDYESDIFGFANALNARSPKDYKKISENFNEYFKRAEVKIDYRCAVDKTERLLG